MATQTEILAQSQLEGASVLLIYDDATLIGSAVQASVSASASGPMTATVTNNSTGAVQTIVVPPNQFNRVFSIPNKDRPHGAVVTTQFGTQTIDWGINVGISFNG